MSQATKTLYVFVLARTKLLEESSRRSSSPSQAHNKSAKTVKLTLLVNSSKRLLLDLRRSTTKTSSSRVQQPLGLTSATIFARTSTFVCALTSTLSYSKVTHFLNVSLQVKKLASISFSALRSPSTSTHQLHTISTTDPSHSW
jgi:hypothetical protein